MASRNRTRSSLRASNSSFVVSTDLGSHQNFILEEMLLSGEWRDIKDIIKVSIKALSEIVKTQSTCIRDLERQMATKVGKNELEFQLASLGGSSSNDLLGQPRRQRLAGDAHQKGIVFNNNSSNIMDTLKLSDLESILKDFVSVSELQYELSSRVTIQEVRQLLHPKVPQEHKHDFNLLRARVDDVQRETELAVSRKELESVFEKLENKAERVDVEEKASKSSVSAALQRKANRSEVEEIRKNQESELAEILDIIKNKADKRELEMVKDIAGEVEEIRREIEIREINDRDVLESLQRDVEQVMKEITAHKREMDLTNREVDSVKREIDQAKREIDSVKRETENVVASTQPRLRELHELSRRLEEQISESKCERSLSERLAVAAVTEQTSKIASSQLREIEQLNLEVSLLKEQQMSAVNQNTQQFQILDGKLHSQGSQWMGRLQDEIALVKKDILSNQKELVRAIAGKVDLQEVQSALNVNSASIAAGIMEHKEDVNRVIHTLKAEIVSSKRQSNYDTLDLNAKQYHAQLATLTQQIDSLAEDMHNNCLKNTTFQQHLLQTKAALDAVQLDMSNKPNFSDLLQSKSEIEIIHRTLREIYKELAAKAFQEDLSNVINDQAIINESLCTENIVGRWTWKSHNLKQGNLIPWESQIANTLPDNFLWEKDKSHVQCVTPGLYQVSFGFYCGKRPNVKLLVNGELALSSETVQTATKFGGALQGDRNVSGLTLTDFLVLAERSRISLIFDGEHYDAEGFLGLKRL